MKLVKCYVENFGTLLKFDYDFADGLNVFNHENGWGKTTFTIFIKAMFYGLNKYKGDDLDENERKKYMPWQGGNFGGSLDFKVKNKTYRVERFFGRVASEDSFKLIDLTTGQPSKDFSNKLGNELFDLDADGFQRTLFIPQKVLDAKMNESIATKLTNLIHGTDEKFNLEKATKLLDEKRASLTNRNKTGQIQILENSIVDKKMRVQQLSGNTSQIQMLKLQILAIDNEIKKIDQENVNLQVKISEQLALQKMQEVTTVAQPQVTEKKPKPTNNKIWYLMLIFAGVLALAGVVCMTLSLTAVLDLMLWVPVALLVGGVLVSAAACLMMVRRKKTTVKKDYQQVVATMVEKTAQYDLPSLYNEQAANRHKIDAYINNKMNKIAALQRYEDELVELNYLQSEINVMQEELAELQIQLAGVTRAMEFLKLANENMNTKYLEPMQKSLQKYLKLFTLKKYDNIVIDTACNLFFTEHGQARELDYYSQGYKNLFELCLRLALMDALFQKEKPFIMLDDPFVNLDASKLDHAKEFLNNLAKNCQVLYFTCHESRC